MPTMIIQIYIDDLVLLGDDHATSTGNPIITGQISRRGVGIVSTTGEEPWGQ